MTADDDVRTTIQQTPALTASQASWRCVQAGDRDSWLALMADEVVIEDPIGQAVTNPDGRGVRGKAAVGDFFDANIAKNQLSITCEETFPSSSPYRNMDAMTFGKHDS